MLIKVEAIINEEKFEDVLRFHRSWVVAPSVD